MRRPSRVPRRSWSVAKDRPGQRRGRRARRALAWTFALGLAAGVGATAHALETDQYYAWRYEIRDSVDVLNAKVNVEIARVLDDVNRRRRDVPCERVTLRIIRHFRLFIYHDLELWASNTSLVDRIPRNASEDFRYRAESLYHATHPFDTGTWMPPTPTLEVDGIRLGTDKLTHFFSEGAWYYRGYRKARGRGASDAEAVDRAIRHGILVERTVLGWVASGVLSPGDLEANYEGMRYFDGLCHGDRPDLVRTGDGWRLRRPFDFRRHVGPEWDESYSPNLYSKGRWKRVRPVLATYCDALDDPTVAARRERYRARDDVTPTEEILRELVERGKLPDPERFTLDAVCRDPAPP